MSCAVQSIEIGCVRAALSLWSWVWFWPQWSCRAAQAARRMRHRSRIPSSAALLLDGRTQSGRLVSLGPAAITLASAEGARHELPMDHVFKLTREVSGSVAALDRSMVVLPDGDRLMRLTLGSATETALDVQSDTLGKLSRSARIPAGMDHGGAGPSRRPRRAVGSRSASSRARRKLSGSRTATGSRADSWDGTTGRSRCSSSGKPREIDRTGIVAVGFDPALVNYPRPKSAIPGADLE